MVRERRLAPMEEDALLKKARAMMVEFGAQTISCPKGAEWDAFENLYFELKDLVGYSPDPGQRYNSMSDLAMLAWNLKTGAVKCSADDPIFFVTENASILAAAPRIQERIGIRIVHFKDFDRMLREGGGKTPEGPRESGEK